MRSRARDLNYHHLFYFWHIVREGSVQGASRALGVSQPTISEQLAALERSLREKLFVREGKSLVLTEVGQVVHGYAEEIFLLGREMQGVLSGRSIARAPRLVVGITEGIPKLLAFRLLEPALRMAAPPRIVCYEDPPERLVADLASRALDIVLSESPVPADAKRPVYSHLLGESEVAFFATRALAVRMRPWFPQCLASAPLVLPTSNTALRRSIDGWLHDRGIRPHVAAEVQDSGLMARFAEQGIGAFASCVAVEQDLRTHDRLELVGRMTGVRQSFYAFSTDRKLAHPAVRLLTRTARSELRRD